LSANSDHPPTPERAVPAPRGFAWRRLAQPWRSPADQPRWARPCLLAVAALAAVLYAWNIGDSQYNGYFSTAVRSMTESPKAFLYGTVDPAASISIDKVPGFLWPQALSALVFGFHPWALALPQVIEGVVSVLVLYRVVRRWAGPAAGLLASAIFALTPITAVMFGHSLMEDSALTMCLILAADAWQEAAGTARLRPLVLAGVWVGLGFQAKMLQAWAVLPAFAAVYLLVAPTALRGRLRQLLVAGAVTVAVSASWILIATLTPAAHRPYIDGTTNNSALVMVVGYNGLSRFGILEIPGTLHAAATGSGLSAGSSGSHPAAVGGGGLPPQVQQLLEQTATQERTGWGKLFAPDLATQIGWLYPLGILALLAGLARRRGTPRTDQTRGGYLMWGTWLILTGLAFSAGTVAHASYTAALAAPLAALAGAGMIDMWRAHRRGSPWAWLLPTAVAADGAWTTYLLARRLSFLPWLLPVMLILTAVGVAGLLVARTGGRVRGRLAAAGLAVAVAAMLVAPAGWAASTLDSRYAGTVLDAYAGPTTDSGVSAQFTRPPATLTVDQQRILDYATAHRDGARYLFATDSWNAASPYILATGAPILPMGGFSGQAPFPTLAQFQQLVSTGQVRQVLLSGGFDIFQLFRGAGAAPADTPVMAITGWVRQHCTTVLPASGAPAGSRPAGPPTMGTGTLYSCPSGP
jgi:4-amino-4-deoxy-L-arabinose transferase-like glycosyltransferase